MANKETQAKKDKIAEAILADKPKFTEFLHFNVVSLSVDNGRTKSNYGQEMFPVVQMDETLMRKEKLRQEQKDKIRGAMNAYNDNQYEKAKALYDEYEGKIKELLESIEEHIPEGNRLHKLEMTPSLGVSQKVVIAQDFKAVKDRIAKAVAAKGADSGIDSGKVADLEKKLKDAEDGKKEAENKAKASDKQADQASKDAETANQAATEATNRANAADEALKTAGTSQQDGA